MSRLSLGLAVVVATVFGSQAEAQMFRGVRNIQRSHVVYYDTSANFTPVYWQPTYVYRSTYLPIYRPCCGTIEPVAMATPVTTYHVDCCGGIVATTNYVHPVVTSSYTSAPVVNSSPISQHVVKGSSEIVESPMSTHSAARPTYDQPAVKTIPASDTPALQIQIDSKTTVPATDDEEELQDDIDADADVVPDTGDDFDDSGENE